MADFGNYAGAGEVYLNGRLLAEIEECERQLQSNDNEVNTMIKGFAGFSDGPTHVRITGTTAIPKAGYEVDYERAVRLKLTVTFVFIDGGQRLTHVGRITDLTSSRSTSASAKANFTFVGVPVGATR